MKRWLHWQLLDSAFPTGAFAHAGGLEAAWQAQEVQDAAAFAGFVRESLWQAGHGSVPFVTAACASENELKNLDRLCDATISNHVAKRASIAQGQALLVAAESALELTELRGIREAIRNGVRPQGSPLRSDRIKGHLAPMFGAVMGLLGVDEEEAAAMFLFTVLRGLVSAGVRLGIVGALEGQRLQHALSPHAQEVAERCARLPVDEVCQTAPLIDLAQGMQDRLYSRLFQS